ncbi:MAG: ribosome biogenesis GTP-binding protein YihA/YsxC [Eubacteriales bacterium]|jgi:GTP-binding protein
MVNFNTAAFVKSAASRVGFLRDGLPQLAFAGRSNVGKSSTLNCLCRRKALARVSGTPGKTAHVNYFSLGDPYPTAYLVDLPGYGFAKVSKSERERWGRLMEDYFTDNRALKMLVLLTDARHAPTADDCTMLDVCRARGIAYRVVANKCDKLKASGRAEAVALTAKTLDVPEAAVLLFSAETGEGRELLERELRACL